MAVNHANGIECAEFEALLAAALDHALDGPEQRGFAAHRASCQACGSLYSEAETGLALLRALRREEVEPPARLTSRILAATSGAVQPAKSVRQSRWQRLSERARRLPVLAGVLQPRFAMSFAMAFFSISLLFNLAGIGLRDLRSVDLRPSAMMRELGAAEGKIMKYYDNIRFVYEIESRVRDLKRVTTPEEAPERRPPQPKQPPAKNNRSAAPERNQRYRQSSEAAGPAVDAQARMVPNRNPRRWL